MRRWFLFVVVVSSGLFLSRAEAEESANDCVSIGQTERDTDFIVGSALFAPPPPQLPGVLQKCTQDPALAARFLSFVEGYESELGFLSPENLNALS